MEKVINLVRQGETKQALERLQTLVDTDKQDSVTLLLARFNTHQKTVNKGTQDLDNKIINQIHEEILLICKEGGGVYTTQKFPLPPILDNLPLDKEGYLLGRKAALEELHNSLQSKNILTLVNGMGGIGKSTLASFYANFPPYKAAYQHCFWVSVSDLTGEVKEAIINAFAEALALYQIPQKEQLAKIQTYLSSLQGQTLLILDNANDKKKVTEALDFLRKCKIKVLFTSRANMTNIPAQALEKLLPEDAFTLFTHYFPAGAAMLETPQLLKNIDYHTLLTEFMAKSLAHNPVLSLQDLVEITQQQNFTDELLAYTQFTTYHTHTHDNPDMEIQPAKYLLQIFPIQNLSEQEQQILRYFSILPTEWIEMNMLKQLFIFNSFNLKNEDKGVFKFILNFILKIAKFVYPNQKQEELKLGTILQSLHEKGWLQKSPTNAFACHILLQHLLRQQLQPNAENCELLLENLYTAIWLDGYTNKLTLASYLPLVATALTWTKDETKLIANIYNNSAAIYRAISNYAQALSYDLENVRIKEKVLSHEHPDLATAYNNIGVTYKKLSDYQKALQYGLKALAIREKVLSAEHPDVTNSYGNIGLTYQYLGDYQKSLEYGLKALSIFEKILSAEHPDLATSYNNIGLTYQYLGDYQKSLEYGLKDLAICEKVLSADHPNLALSYHNIATTYRKLGNYQKSLEYGLKALSIYKKVLSAEHPDLANSYNTVAAIYYHIKDYTTAYSFIQKAITIWTKVLPKGHPHIQIALDAKTMIEKAMRKK